MKRLEVTANGAVVEVKAPCGAGCGRGVVGLVAVLVCLRNNVFLSSVANGALIFALTVSIAGCGSNGRLQHPLAILGSACYGSSKYLAANGALLTGSSVGLGAVNKGISRNGYLVVALSLENDGLYVITSLAVEGCGTVSIAGRSYESIGVILVIVAIVLFGLGSAALGAGELNVGNDAVLDVRSIPSVLCANAYNGLAALNSFAVQLGVLGAANLTYLEFLVSRSGAGSRLSSFLSFPYVTAVRIPSEIISENGLALVAAIQSIAHFAVYRIDNFDQSVSCTIVLGVFCARRYLTYVFVSSENVHRNHREQHQGSYQNSNCLFHRLKILS